MKVVGKRIAAKGLENTDILFRLVLSLRAGKPFLPKGVYRFTTFKDAQEWSLRMKTRKNLTPQR